MKLGLAALAVLPLLVACSPVGIDVRHARTDAGYINSALADAGRLYVLDTTSGHETMLQVADIPMSDATKGASFKSFKASNVVGADLKGSAAAVAEVSAKIEANAFVELTNAQVTTYQNTYTALAAEINRRVTAKENVGESWRLTEATEAGSPLRYVLIYGVVAADKGRFGYDDTAGASGKLLFDKSLAVQLGFSVKGADEQLFEQGPALVKYYVLKAYLDVGGAGETTYHFARDFEYDTKQLPAMLRKSE